MQTQKVMEICCMIKIFWATNILR